MKLVSGILAVPAVDDIIGTKRWRIRPGERAIEPGLLARGTEQRQKGVSDLAPGIAVARVEPGPVPERDLQIAVVDPGAVAREDARQHGALRVVERLGLPVSRSSSARVALACSTRPIASTAPDRPPTR
jgi:hypothetical protein